MKNSLPILISRLLEPARYGESVTKVDLIETHVSWVLLAGNFTYKIKKTIKLPFLDYSTLNNRRFYCEEELRLNNRFAQDLYLGIVEILGSPEQPLIGFLNVMTGRAIEYAVKMKRFEEAMRLDHVCERGELTLDHITQLAKAISHFHRITAVSPGDSYVGTPIKIIEPVIENINELKTLLSDQKDQQIINDLAQWSHTDYERLIPQFLERKKGGYIRECHGDLHLGNLVLINDKVTLFDCIDFNEAFRWIDVVSEISFTYVDLLDHHQPGLAGWFLTQWLSETGDFSALYLLRFYSIYRALIRAKVAAIRATQNDFDFTTTRHYLALAKELKIVAKPTLTITHGLSGCGKTTAAIKKLLADPLGATLCIRSDVERKRLFGLAADAHSGSLLNSGIYSVETSLLTYRRLSDLTEQLLTAGWSVIVDAAFLRLNEREAFRQLADKYQISYYILAPQSSIEELKQRITKRSAEGKDASEATLAVLDKQLTFIEMLNEIERNNYLISIS